MTRVSVIIPCRNEARHLRPFLDSLARQETAGMDVEYLIADGMSDDGTRDILAEYAAQSPRWRCIDNPGRIVSTGLNAAIRQAKGEVIVRMDAHTEFDPSYLSNCLDVLRETHADNVGGPARTHSEGRWERAIAAAYHSPFSTGGAKFHDPSYEGPVDTVTYGCWPRAVFDRIGLFDEELVRNQDDELNLRLTRAGGKLWQSPRIVSWYRPRGDLRSLFRQYFQYGFWKVAVIRRHRIPASWRHLVPGAFVLSVGGLLIALLVGLLTGFAVRWTAAALFAVLLAYAAALMVFSVRTARQAGGDLLPLLPLVFATFHVSYGLGFVAGWLRRPESSVRFTELSR